MLFLLCSFSSGVIGITQTTRQDVLTKETVMVHCVIGDRPTQKQVSVDSCERLQRLFSAIIEANAVDPCGENTRMLKVQFIEMLADFGLFSQACLVEELCSLIEPSWSITVEAPRWGHLMPRENKNQMKQKESVFFSSADLLDAVWVVPYEPGAVKTSIADSSCY